MRRRLYVILLLVGLSLACNFPGFPGAAFAAITPTASLPEEDDPGAAPSGDGPAADRPTPAPLETATPEGFVAPATLRPTATRTPTPTPTATATPEAVAPGPPLAFEEPSWSLGAWHQVEGTSDWEGTIDIHVTGGTPPYRAQLENQEIVDGLTVLARWRLCKAMPATIRVWSADDQAIEQQIWVWELGCSGD